VDCTVAPIIWRLSHYEIDLPSAEAQPILDYAENMFSRQSFSDSLTELEEEMRA
jgi:RNA polymerase-associated protein